MNIREINKPVTAASLNESMAKRFGKKVALEKFTLEQLQDVRNRVRTTLSQVETNESFSSVQKNEYQKNKLFLDVLNAEISERADIDEAGKRPDYPDVDDDGNTEEPIADAAKDAKKDKETKEAMNPSAFEPSEPTGDDEDKKKKKPVKEGAEDEAELVMASKDMVNRVTNWMEDTAEMQTESMLELADAIRDEKGQEASDAFVQTVKPALESLYSAMESTRESLIQGVGQLTGEGEIPDMMGAEAPADDMPADMEPTVDQEETGVDLSGDDGMAAAPAAAGGEEEAGRAKRESVRRHKKSMLETSRRLGTILSKKK